MVNFGELLSYDAETGEFRWLVKPSAHVFSGDLAGSVNTRGYRNISFQRKWYGAHRLAWLFVYGEWPKGNIDHINGYFSDNRIKNLRLATSSQNSFNRRKHKHTKSGFKGVYVRKYGFEATIMAHGKAHYLGKYKTPQEAHSAYLTAAKELHGEFSRGE